MKIIYFTISESSQVTSQFCELARGSWKFHRGLAFYLILDFLGYSKILLEKKKRVINLLTLTYLVRLDSVHSASIFYNFHLW